MLRNRGFDLRLHFVPLAALGLSKLVDLGLEGTSLNVLLRLLFL